MKPLVSIIVPCHNRKLILKDVLAQLDIERRSFPVEVIVVDNASRDGSAAMIRSRYPWVRLSVLEQNLGAVSRNIGIDKARGEYILMLDDDSYPLPGAIQGGVSALQEDRQQKIGCIAYNIQRPDGSFETAGISSAFTGCGALFRRAVFDRIGGYPDDYLFYVEEYDLSCRLWAHGMRVANPRDLIVLHLKTDVGRDFNMIMRQLVRNNMMLWSKYLPKVFADRQIQAELWRYSRIALKEKATAGFEEGYRLGEGLYRRFHSDRSNEIDTISAERMLTLDTIRSVIAQLDQYCSGTRILLWTVGKQLYLIIQELRIAGWEIVGVVDDNRHMQGDSYEGVPVLSNDAFLSESYDLVLIGSSALAVNDQLEAAARTYGIQTSIIRMCQYDNLSNARD